MICPFCQLPALPIQNTFCKFSCKKIDHFFWFSSSNTWYIQDNISNFIINSSHLGYMKDFSFIPIYPIQNLPLPQAAAFLKRFASLKSFL